jgi:hypothetical protein
MFQPKKPFWQMNIKELQEYVNQFKTTKKKRFNYRKRFTLKKQGPRKKRLKIRLRTTRKNIN